MCVCGGGRELPEEVIDNDSDRDGAADLRSVRLAAGPRRRLPPLQRRRMMSRVPVACTTALLLRHRTRLSRATTRRLPTQRGRSGVFQASRLRGVIAGGGGCGGGGGGGGGRGGGGVKRAPHLVQAGVRAGDEPDGAQQQRDHVERQPPSVRAVVGAAVTGDGHVAQRREDERQERAGHGAHHRYEQAQMRYRVGRDNCNTRASNQTQTDGYTNPTLHIYVHTYIYIHVYTAADSDNFYRGRGHIIYIFDGLISKLYIEIMEYINEKHILIQ